MKAARKLLSNAQLFALLRAVEAGGAVRAAGLLLEAERGTKVDLDARFEEPEQPVPPGP